MRMGKWLLSLGIIVLLIGIAFLISNNLSSKTDDATVVINIQPLDGIEDVSKVTEEFVKFYLEPLGLQNHEIRVLPHKNTPDSTFNTARTRYRANKIVNFLHYNTRPGEFTIGVTDKDISTSIHGSNDYGILGLSFLGHTKRACITSTYRLKYKKDLWKLIAHEFTHGYFSQNHCRADDDACIMQDAKGKSPRFENKCYLCPQCLHEIEQKRR